MLGAQYWQRLTSTSVFLGRYAAMLCCLVALMRHFSSSKVMACYKQSNQHQNFIRWVCLKILEESQKPMVYHNFSSQTSWNYAKIN